MLSFFLKMAKVSPPSAVSALPSGETATKGQRLDNTLITSSVRKKRRPINREFSSTRKLVGGFCAYYVSIIG